MSRKVIMHHVLPRYCPLGSSEGMVKFTAGRSVEDEDNQRIGRRKWDEKAHSQRGT